MKKLDFEEYVKALAEEIDRLEEECVHASKNQWYEKAAKLQMQREGVRKAKFMAEAGDYVVG